MKKIKQFGSTSKPNVIYTVYESRMGSLYCDCWQWKRKRTCKHLELVQEELAVQHTTTVPTSIEMAISEAVSLLRRSNE